jgi:hypothetical protein
MNIVFLLQRNYALESSNCLLLLQFIFVLCGLVLGRLETLYIFSISYSLSRPRRAVRSLSFGAFRGFGGKQKYHGCG